MALLDFLKPKWKREDPKARIDGINKVQDECILNRLGESDPDEAVRTAALERLRYIKEERGKADNLVAAQALRRGDLDTVIRHSTRVIESGLPEKSLALFAAYTGRGLARSQQNDYSSAIDDLRKAVVASPFPARTLIQLGTVHFSAEEYKEAEDVLTAALAQASDDHQKMLAHLYRGGTRLRLGDTDGARKDCDSYLGFSEGKNLDAEIEKLGSELLDAVVWGG